MEKMGSHADSLAPATPKVTKTPPQPNSPAAVLSVGVKWLDW
jgi:hypothetical protein